MLLPVVVMQGDERFFHSVERPPPQVVGGEWSLTVGWVPRAPESVTSLSISEKGNENFGRCRFF